MHSTLVRSGVSVRQSRRASAARRLARDWLPHVILLDVRLAGDNGYTTAQQIRERWPPGRPLPHFVMISADPPEAPLLQALAAQGDRFLLKPFTARQLMDAVSGSSRTRPTAHDGRTSVAATLQSLFRSELAGRLEALDRCLAQPDLPAAQGILHRLIASSALCRQRRLERDLRSLYDTCRRPINSSALARGYFALLLSSRDYLDAP